MGQSPPDVAQHWSCVALGTWHSQPSTLGGLVAPLQSRYPVAQVYEQVAPKPLVSPLQLDDVSTVIVDAHLSPHALQLLTVFRSPQPESNGASGDEPSGGASVPPSMAPDSLASTVPVSAGPSLNET